MKTWTLTILVLLFIAGCGGDGGKKFPSLENNKKIDEQGTIKKDYSFENAPLINLRELQKSDVLFNNKKIIRISKNHNSTPNSIFINIVSKVKDDIAHIAQLQTKELRGTNLDDNLYTNTVIEQGNISGTLITDMKIDKKTGKFSGSIITSNYKNSESSSCGENIIYQRWYYETVRYLHYLKW